MLAELRKKYEPRSHQIALVEASCLEWPPGLGGFDFAMSILTVHHFPPDTKVKIYESIRSALKEDGVYIEGDQTVKPEVEASSLGFFEDWIAKLPGGRQGGVELRHPSDCRNQPKSVDRCRLRHCRQGLGRWKNRPRRSRCPSSQGLTNQAVLSPVSAPSPKITGNPLPLSDTVAASK